ncbi:hypothetical protein EVA_14571 [gut metagenome]|uniref:Uncharacterized protein n=1 Tax=gut metagenome TaxID=749906 RepID=J9FS46_9ZZZZ
MYQLGWFSIIRNNCFWNVKRYFLCRRLFCSFYKVCVRGFEL